MTSIPENLARLQRSIAAMETRYQRATGSVRLLVVSKQQQGDRIRQAYAAGARDFGENYLQEALSKQSELADLEDLVWHYIGPIQSNKTRGIAENFQWVHSVDRTKIAERLHEQRPAALPPLNCCVQVNISAEDSKSGVALDSAAELCETIASLPRLQLRGLMAIPEALTDFAAQRHCFHRLADHYRLLCKRFTSMDTLSMGMSGDFEAAIAEGSTMVRLGTAIFGPRAR